MITIETYDVPNGAVSVTSSGHSSKLIADVKEGSLVCAATSHMMFSLAAIFGGSESSGYVSVVVPRDKLAHAEFVIAGLQILARNHPMHLRFQLHDSRLFSTTETQSWKLREPKQL